MPEDIVEGCSGLSQFSTLKEDTIQRNYAAEQKYDCLQCGYCCKHDWKIHVDRATVENIRLDYRPLALIESQQPAFLEEDGDITLGRTSERHCVFLQESSNCGIHSALGMDAKPRDCQHYPFSLVETPDGVQVGVSYSCTATLKNQGRALEEHSGVVDYWLKDFRPTRVGFEPSPFFENLNIDWPAYQLLEQRMNWAIAHTECEGALARTVVLLQKYKSYKTTPTTNLTMNLADIAYISNASLAAVQVNYSESLAMQLEYFGLLQLGYLGTCNRVSQEALLNPFDDDSIIDAPNLSWSGSASQFRSIIIPAGTSCDFEPEIKRYISAQMFQKTLLRDTDLWTGLIKLSMVPRLIRQGAALIAHGNSSHPHLTPYQRALRLVEEDVISHSGASSKIYALLGSALMAAQ